MEIVNFTERALPAAQWAALQRLAADAARRVEVWGYDGQTVRAQSEIGGVRDWLIDADGTTWRRHAAIRVEQIPHR